jgi:hypothetical protein
VIDFDRGKWRRGYLTTIAAALLVVMLPSAWLFLTIGFQDSMGNPRNNSLTDHLRVYAAAFAPLLIPSLLIYWDWRPSRRPKPER